MTTIYGLNFSKLKLVYRSLCQNKIDSALDILKDLERNTRSDPEEYVHVLLAFGYVYVQLKQYDLALEYFEKCLSLPSTPPEVYLLMSLTYSELGKYETALEYADLALSLTKEPKESWLQFTLALQLEMGKVEEAQTTLNSILHQAQ